MNPNIYKIKIDTILELKNEHFTVSSSDINSHKLNIEVTQNNEPYPLTGLSVHIHFLKSDGKLNEQEVIIDNAIEGKLACILETNSINKQGRVRAEVLISKNGDLLTTKRFQFYVTNPLATDKVIESTTEFPILNKLITKVESMIQTQIEMVQAEDVRQDNEQLRITLHSELLGLKSTLESLKITLEDTNTDVEDNENNRIINENARIDNEVLRETLYNNLLQLEVDLLDLNNTTISLIADTSTAITNTNIATGNANSAATNANNISNAIVQAEGLRVTAESLRVKAEGLRVTAEQARETNYTQKINEFITETERVEAIYPTRLTKVEMDLDSQKEELANKVVK